MGTHKLEKLHTIVKAQEIVASQRRQRKAVLTVKQFQDLRDHLADRKALEEIISSHKSEAKIVIRRYGTSEKAAAPAKAKASKKADCKCPPSGCFGTGLMMLLAGATAGYAGMKYIEQQRKNQ